jgi:hypothetical protein
MNSHSSSLKEQDSHFPQLYNNAISLENGRFLILTNPDQLTKQSISNTGRVSLEYSEPFSSKSPSKSLCIEIGRDTPLFRSIQSAENNEKIKALIFEHVSSLPEVHEIAMSGVKRILTGETAQKSNTVKYKKLEGKEDESLIGKIKLTATSSSLLPPHSVESTVASKGEGETSVSTSVLEANGAKIAALMKGYIAKGEAWKKDFILDPERAIGMRNLRPTEVIADCMEAMKEVTSLSAGNIQHDDDKQALLEKKIVDPSTEVIVTGDIHGDGVSVARMLEKLQADGKLDENFKLVSNTELVFLGDYVDRGPDSWAVLNMLARLKLNNTETVHLIRGNHENIELINQEAYKYGRWMDYVDIEESEKWGRHVDVDSVNEEAKVLEAFFNTLPNAVFLGAKKGGKTEYDIYTHGAVPLSFNPNYLLRQEDGMCVVSKIATSFDLGNHAFTLVDSSNIRLQNLADRVQAAIVKHRIIDERKAKKYIKNEYDEEDNYDYSEEMTNLQYILQDRDQTDREWDWGDITNNKDNFFIGRGADINAVSLVCWMKLSEAFSVPTPSLSLEEQTIFFKRIFKGHSHQQKKETKDEGSRQLYFLDTDLYDNGEFVMQTHTMDGSNLARKDSSEKVYARSYNSEAGVYNPFVERNFIK